MHPDVPSGEVLPGSSCRPIAQDAADALDGRDGVIDDLLKGTGCRRSSGQSSFVDVIVFFARKFLLVERKDVAAKSCQPISQNVIVSMLTSHS